jgi:hypothetical protein
MLLYVRLTMSSLRRIKASRANGARSKGPVTPEGKQRSALNARRHCLLSRIVVIDGEKEENFQELLTQHVDRLQPADGVEYALVEEMASAYWRLHRNWAIEKRMIDNQVREERGCDNIDCFVAAFRTLSMGTAFPLLQRYETRLHNMYQRSLRSFLQLRAAKLPNEPNVELPNEPTDDIPNGPTVEFPNEPKLEDADAAAPACATTPSAPAEPNPQSAQPDTPAAPHLKPALLSLDSRIQNEPGAEHLMLVIDLPGR